MKKKLAMLMALSLTLTSLGAVTASAADVTVETQMVGSSDATVEAINDKVYNIVIPTSKALDFIIDPQGIATLSADGDGKALSELTGGTVYAKNQLAIANKSSQDVVVKVKVKAEKDSGIAVNVVPDITANTIVDASVQLAIVPSEATFAVVTEKETNKSNVAEDTTKYVASVENQSKTGYTLGSADITLPVILGKAEYVAKKVTDKTNDKVVNKYEIKEGAMGGAVSFAIAGKCSTVGDWSASGLKGPKVTIAYDFVAATAADSAKLESIKTPATYKLGDSKDKEKGVFEPLTDDDVQAVFNAAENFNPIVGLSNLTSAWDQVKVTLKPQYALKDATTVPTDPVKVDLKTYLSDAIEDASLFTDSGKYGSVESINAALADVEVAVKEIVVDKPAVKETVKYAVDEDTLTKFPGDLTVNMPATTPAEVPPTPVTLLKATITADNTKSVYAIGNMTGTLDPTTGINMYDGNAAIGTMKADYFTAEDGKLTLKGKWTDADYATVAGKTITCWTKNTAGTWIDFTITFPAAQAS